MSERGEGGGSGFGAFLLGIAVGAVVGFLFAPEAGDDTRRKLSKRLHNLRDVAAEKVDEVRGLLEAEPEGEEEQDEDEAEENGSTRERLQRRLEAARRRRRRGAGGAGRVEKEDEPLA